MVYYKILGISAASLWKSLYREPPHTLSEDFFVFVLIAHQWFIKKLLSRDLLEYFPLGVISAVNIPDRKQVYTTMMICFMKKTCKLDCLYMTMQGGREENRSTSFF